MKLLTILACFTSAAAGAIDYTQEIKPIFAEHCYRCHGASQQKGGLRIDTVLSALKGGDAGSSLLPRHPEKSLLLQVLKGGHDDIPRMPYKKSALPAAQIALIEKWIAEGAQAPSGEQPEQGTHWSFLPPEHMAPPGTKLKSGIRNPIDAFIVARLEKEGITPAPEASKTTLLRRLSLDLTGLPPTPREIENFLSDQRAGAYQRQVDRLLASPHYGERWARHWLDLARYADSNGYSIDAPRSIWKYRDYVINALNHDLPFDQFVIEQIAGDLLSKPTLEQKIATGFHRNTQINQEGGIDPEQFRIESVLDRVNTTSTAFLGLTIGCAQCHDHKFDPIAQREYYQLFAFFNNTIDDGHGKGAPEGQLEIPGETEPMENMQKELEEAEADLDRYLDTKGSEVVKWEETLGPGEREQLKPELQKILGISFAERTPKQKRALYSAFRPADTEFKQRNAKVLKLEKRQPKPVTTLVMVEQSKPRDSFIFIKGDFTRKGDPVLPQVPAIIPPPLPAPASSNAILTRLDLARWIVDLQNPLTARVLVNRLWQEYFGRGIVETENDFGTQGSPPSHPELLDWLATELIAQKWSLKAMHRLIVTSSTYRQSSQARPDLANSDPNNRLLARQSRLRLDAEIVRDIMLASSGLLDEKIGGPSVFPPQPDGVMKLGQSKRDWKISAGHDRYRRGMYTFFWRATPHPALTVFDAPDAFSTCTRRLRSNTPLQALTLLNDAAYFEFAQALARRILDQNLRSDDARLTHAFQLCLSRSPSIEEKARLKKFLQQQQQRVQHSAPPKTTFASQKISDLPDDPSLAAWTSVARVILNLDEMITRE